MTSCSRSSRRRTSRYTTRACVRLGREQTRRGARRSREIHFARTDREGSGRRERKFIDRSRSSCGTAGFASAALGLLLSACGGSGGSHPSNPTPATTTNPCSTAACSTRAGRSVAGRSGGSRALKTNILDGNPRWRVLWTPLVTARTPLGATRCTGRGRPVRHRPQRRRRRECRQSRTMAI